MAEWRGGSQCRHGPAWADPAPPTPSPPTPRLPAFQMPPFPHPPLSPSPQLGTDLQEGGREAGQRASVPSILPALSAANLGPSSAFITPPPACPPAYPPNPKRVLDQVPNRAASSGIPVTMHCCVSATAAWHSWGRVRAWGVEQQRERGMRTQRRKRAIAKTPRKKDGERWQSCLAPGQFPAEDGQLLLPGLR
nr:WAS/WASL-interacting protein family member 1-like isoform X3 [Halichoerus grypus]